MKFIVPLVSFVASVIGKEPTSLDKPPTFSPPRQSPVEKYIYHKNNHTNAHDLGIPFVGILFTEEINEASPVPLYKSNATKQPELTEQAKKYVYISAINSKVVVLQERLDNVVRLIVPTAQQKSQKYKTKEICDYFRISRPTFWRIIRDGKKYPEAFPNNKTKCGRKPTINDVLVGILPFLYPLTSHV